MEALQPVLILEDTAATREWLREVVAQAFGTVALSVAATLAEADHWLRGMPAGAAPICLVDLGLPDGSGIDFIRRLLARLPAARAVILTLFDDDAHLLGGMAAGAHGYVLKDQDKDQLVHRLGRLQAGETPMTPAMAERVLALFRDHARAVVARAEVPAVELTAREEEVLRLIGRGLTVAEAAGTLGLSALTVAGYVKAIYRKLDICSRAEAASEAARRGLL